MIDGVVGLIVLVAVLRGAIKGIGDTIIKILCIVGGVGLGIYYKDKLKAFLLQTKLEKTMHSRIFEMIRGGAAADPSSEEGVDSFFGSIISPDGTGEGVISKSLGGIFSDAADKAADAAAERLTEIAMGVIAFALIILAVSLVAFVLRMIIKSLRETSIVIGFADRVLGMVREYNGKRMLGLFNFSEHYCRTEIETRDRIDMAVPEREYIPGEGRMSEYWLEPYGFRWFLEK